jgi:diacylglycerol O-acyltransferase / wax synthase
MAAESLSTLDNSFVTLERDGLPMHVGGLAVLDSASRPQGPIRPAELRTRLRRGMRSLPRLRSRLKEAPLSLGRPSWVLDERFNVDRHIERWSLAPGSGWPELLQLAGELHGRLLPRDRPLWRVSLIDGLPRGRQALLTMTHHAATDGIAGMEVTQAIFDRPRLPSAPPHPQPASGFFGSSGTTDRVTRALQATVGVARYLAGGPIALPGPFNGVVGPKRALATADLRLDEARMIKQRLGGSVDDVVLASVALALGQLLERRGHPTEGVRLRAMVPVSTRAGADGLGNHVSATFLDLPIDLPPVQCLHDVAAAKALHRTWHEPLGLKVAAEAAGLASPLLAAPLTWVLCSMPFANLIVSDIPGPAEPLALLGAPMIGAYPLMPITATVGLAIGVVTIGGSMGVGVTTDPELVPDGAELAREIGEGFAALLHAARQQPHRQRSHSPSQGRQAQVAQQGHPSQKRSAGRPVS